MARCVRRSELRTTTFLVGILSIGLCGPASAGDVANVIRDLYSGDGVRGIQIQTPTHEAHFIATGAQELENFNDDIVQGLGVLGLNSALTSVTFDLDQGIPVQTRESLGPLIAERAETLGQGKINFGVSFTRIDYDEFNGDDLDDLEIELGHNDCCTIPPGGIPDPDGRFAGFERDVIHLDVDLEIEQNIFAFFATYGVTDNLDLGFLVPVVQSEARAKSSATIIDVSGTGAHDNGFDNSPDDERSKVERDDTGLGDIQLRGKWNFVKDQGALPDLALVSTVSLPTGDSDDLSGTGETGLTALGVASKTVGRFTPHLNLGYQYFTGDQIESNIRAVAGADVKIVEPLTVAIDVIGRLEPFGETDQVDLAGGLKWEILDTAVISANGIVPLNDDGLRSDFIWTLALSTVF